jgi:glutamate-1-semialdehyde 2,1-aminomutase
MKAHALKRPAPAPENGRSRPAQARGAVLLTDDGRELIDFDNASGAVLLGHADPGIEAAVEACVASQTVRLRVEVAERLLSFMPLAQAVYLFASLDQARRTALELARTATGRDVVLSSAPLPGGGCEAFDAGDLDALSLTLERRAVAAIVTAPVGLERTCPRHLAGLRALADRHGACLVFDETVSAFRVHEGGAQTLFNVRPDLTLIGESLANGRPIAALVGDPILLAAAPPVRPPAADSLAAAAATLARLGDEPVITTLAVRGAEVQAELVQRVAAHGAGELVSVAGDPSMSSLVFADAAVESACLRELRARGIWREREHFISCAHGDREIARLLDAYDAILPELVRRASGEEGVVRLQQRRLEREYAR